MRKHQNFQNGQKKMKQYIKKNFFTKKIKTVLAFG